MMSSTTITNRDRPDPAVVITIPAPSQTLIQWLALDRETLILSSNTVDLAITGSISELAIALYQFYQSACVTTALS